MGTRRRFTLPAPSLKEAPVIASWSKDRITSLLSCWKKRPKTSSTGLCKQYIFTRELCCPGVRELAMLAQSCGSKVTASVTSMNGPAQKLCSLTQSASTLHISDPMWPAASSKCSSGCWFWPLNPLTLFVHYPVQLGIVFSKSLLLWSWL